ncbi:MAG: Bug family tripartite tricarboxylate transporter substrate binding protein [Pigmentiphaga sp.]|jgi:tripartite-type tricarboxylate transporter receptor subunit TctC|uniref:Bug family tripartite tricarboxylate transporter substrate binding protein n=1 Tax=unclassified Pigmentiphaga TaxID=2626614 RepID=UPI000B40CA9E|nr:tripartite tricarboxylate transporter substrate binding protein [Pigmentiphaga sp. NML030171]OVZ64623.1 hypothetical protein CDO46_08565 [Pigmentiphaga sp. NML030171]
MNRQSSLCATILVSLLGGGTACAAGYPDRPIKMVVPFAVGGLNDVLARIIAPRLTAELGQPVVVENKGGAGSVVGTEQAARARPDGYTLLLSSAALAINPSLYKKLPYDVQRDFVPVIQISSTQMVLLRSPKFEPDSAPALVDYLRKHPGKVNYASSGVGSPSHLASELFVRTYKLDTVHVPYKGAGPALAAIAAGEAEFCVDVLPTAMTMHKSGMLKILALAGDKRSPLLPDVPTLAEVGFPEYAASSWNVIMAPAHTPADVLDKLRATLRKIMESDDMRERMRQLAVEPRSVTGEALAAFIASETDKWGNLIQSASITAD